MNKKIFLSIALLASAYHQTDFATSAYTTPKGIRQQTCIDLMLILRKCLMNNLSLEENRKHLDELAQVYNRLQCFTVEDLTISKYRKDGSVIELTDF